MANCDNKSVTFLNLVLVLSLLLPISITECRQLRSGIGQESVAIECNSVYGAEDGDTCTGIIQKFGLNDEFFSTINPNLSYEKIFLGQWLCINGTVN
ncbi:hypothetical protein I3842_07G040500 [Carya illinoinensis]|uniref:LysM domain-containing protein n=1 Tax=Carya illinoinensis TaxID=32201 RepID=A0A922EIN2_CARIL|nr:hypothetical protein I3842_07G040500 [Carya illinoinensis]